jgi:hypothetical protein
VRWFGVRSIALTMTANAANTTHDIFVRLTVLKTVSGRMTPEKKHKAVKVARHAFDLYPGYTVVSAEVADVRHG